MKTKVFKYLIIIFVSFLIVVPSVNATNAKTIAELRGELQSLKNKKAANEAKKNQTKGEITNAKNNIYSAQNQIEQGKQQIEEAKKEIAALNVEIDNTQESIKNLMNTIGLLNNTGYKHSKQLIFFIICRIYSITHDQSIILINKLTAMQLTAYS